jgi:hypothetical protein
MDTEDLKKMIEGLTADPRSARSLLEESISSAIDAETSSGRLLESALGPPPPAAETGDALREDLAGLRQQLDRLIQSQQGLTAAPASLSNTVLDTDDGGGSTLGAMGRGFASVFRTGFGIAPLVSGLMRLFGGGGGEEPPSLDYHASPAAVRFDFGLNSNSWSGVQQIRYAEGGLPETVRSGPPAALPPITVQVQAIDSRSFLDHSDAIARAVREAILSSSTLNDVVTEI